MINVLYCCHKCGLRDVEVEVRDRSRMETVVEWMQWLAVVVGTDHGKRSPLCRITEISEVKIPMPPGTDKIGAPPVH